MMTTFLEMLLESEAPNTLFTNSTTSELLPHLKSLGDTPNKNKLALNIVQDATENELSNLSEKSLHLQKEFEHLHLKRSAFGCALDIAIKARHFAISLSRDFHSTNTVEDGIEIDYNPVTAYLIAYTDLANPNYLPYASLFAYHFKSMSKDVIPELANQISAQLSPIQYYHLNELIHAAAPESLLFQTLKSHYLNVSALKSGALDTLSDWQNTVGGQAVKMKTDVLEKATTLVDKTRGFLFFEAAKEVENTKSEAPTPSTLPNTPT